MNDATVTTENATSATSANAETATKFTRDDIETSYFDPRDPQQIAAFNTLHRNIHSVMSPSEIEYNWDTSKDENGQPKERPQPGFDLAVIPLYKRSEKEGEGNILTKVFIAQIPSPQLVLNAEGGAEFVTRMLRDTFASRIAYSVRPKKDGSIPGNTPKTLEQFMTELRRGEGLSTFSKLAPKMIKTLKEQGLKLITVPVLRQCLSSSAAAESHFRRLKQSTWVSVINIMRKWAVAASLDPKIFDDWLATRDQATFEVPDEIDLSGLA